MITIYKPTGKAKEYGEYAINIYTGCPHRCFYCFGPNVLHRDREEFHSNVKPREGILEALRERLAAGDSKDQVIHMCFTCDPYPMGYDSSVTREVIRLIKESGNHVQILTKNGTDAERDFDLLDENDWFGVTIAGYPEGSIFHKQEAEPGAGTEAERLAALERAHKLKIKTWVSFEPVLNPVSVLNFLELNVDYVDRYKIGKLNYHSSEVNWKDFGTRAERICQSYHMDYYIKESLREAMRK